MRHSGTFLLVGAVLAFIASLSMHGLAVITATPAVQTDSDLIAPIAAQLPIDMVDVLLVPRSAASLSLLLILGCALAYHALRRWSVEVAPTDGRRRLMLRRGAEGSVARHAPLALGLIAGALWPWLETSRPLTALALAGIMATGLIIAALIGVRQDGRPRKSAALCFVAGWATLAASAMLASWLQGGLGAPPLLASSIGLTSAAILTVAVQLRLGRTISYSVAVILGLVTIAAGAMLASVGMAAVAVLAIAVIAFALVQVST